MMTRRMTNSMTRRKSSRPLRSESRPLRKATPRPSTKASTSAVMTFISGVISMVKKGEGAVAEVSSKMYASAEMSDGNVESAVK